MGKYIDAINKGISRGNARTEAREIVANRLRFLRDKNGYTQKQLAELANIDPATYAGYENKISTPALSALIRIADIYEISLDYLAGRTDNLNGLYASEFKEITDNSSDELLRRISALETEMKKVKENIS